MDKSEPQPAEQAPHQVVAWPMYVTEDGSFLLPEAHHRLPGTPLLIPRVEAFGLEGPGPALLVAGAGRGARPGKMVRKRYELALVQVEVRILEAMGIHSPEQLQA